MLPIALGPVPPCSRCPSCIIPLNHVLQTLLRPNRSLLQPLHPPAARLKIQQCFLGTLSACSSCWARALPAGFPVLSVPSPLLLGWVSTTLLPPPSSWNGLWRSLVCGGPWRLSVVHVIVMSSARGFSNLQSHSSSSPGTQHGTNEGNCPKLSFLKQATQPLLAKHAGQPHRKIWLCFHLGFCHLIANTACSSMSPDSFSPLPFERWLISSLLVESRSESALVHLFLLKYLPSRSPCARLRQDGECHFFVPSPAKGSAPRAHSLIQWFAGSAASPGSSGAPFLSDIEQHDYCHLPLTLGNRVRDSFGLSLVHCETGVRRCLSYLQATKPTAKYFCC